MLRPGIVGMRGSMVIRLRPRSSTSLLIKYTPPSSVISLFLSLCSFVSLPLPLSLSFSLYLLDTFLNLPSYVFDKFGPLVPRLCAIVFYFIFHFQLACSLTIRVAMPGLWVPGGWVGRWMSG